MYYLLGWIVGDAGKNFSSAHTWARLQLDLCSKHPENLILGKYVMDCVSMLGIQYTRYADRPARRRHPHPEHRWQTYYSEVISWLFTACLGLRRNELTSYHRIRMGWLMTATKEHRLWFLRGLADSDGGVNISNKTVEITSEPNTEFFKTLVESLGVPTLSYTSGGVGTVVMKIGDIVQLRIFNPEITNHKATLVQRLAHAKTFPRHWPEQLESRVEALMRQGLDPIAIRDNLLLDWGVYVKLRTVQSKWMRLKAKPAEGFGPSTPCLRGT